MDYADWRTRLRERFPPQHPGAAQREWEQAKARLTVGQSVSGDVVAKAHFGAWIDIGVGFPALLEIVFIDGLTPERYHADDWCPIGSRVSATVSGFNDPARQVGLRQVERQQRGQ
jgi:ribosomal protein S1